MIRTVAIYASALALSAFALEWLDYKRMTREFGVELVIVLIACGFAALGIWVGAQLTPKRPVAPFEQNAAALKSLRLTPREVAVLELIAKGRTNKEIARSLGVSPNTVKTHAANLYEKLGVSRRTGAVDAARRLALLP